MFSPRVDNMSLSWWQHQNDFLNTKREQTQQNMLFEYRFKNKVQNIKKKTQKPEVASSGCRSLHSEPEPLLLEHFDRINVAPRSHVLMVLKENSTPKF